MAIVKSLTVLFKANTAAFDTKLKASSSTVGRFASSVEAAGKRMIRSFALIGAAGAAAFTGAAVAAGYKFKRLVESEMESIDRFAKTAHKLGIGTKALGQLGHAADLTGTNMEAVGKGLQYMLSNVSDAAKGIGTAKDSLEDLGLDPATLKAKSPEAMFRTLADAISKVENPADRVRIAMDVFGRAGVDLINMLAQGSKGLQQMAADADWLGITFGDEAAAGVEAADDAIDRLRKSVKGFGTQAAIELSPFIKVFADELTESVVGVTHDLRSSSKEFGILGAAIISAASSLQEWRKQWLATEIVLLPGLVKVRQEMEFGGLIGGPGSEWLLGKTTGQTPEERAADAAATLRHVDTLKRKLADLEGAPDWGDVLADKVRAAKAAIEEQQRALEGAGGALGMDGGGLSDGLDDASSRLDELRRKADALTESLRSPGEMLESRVQELYDMLAEGFITEEQYFKGGRQLREASGLFTPPVPALQAPIPAAAVLRGSIEEKAAMAQARRLSDDANWQKKQEDIGQQQLEVQEEALKRLESIDDKSGGWSPAGFLPSGGGFAGPGFS